MYFFLRKIANGFLLNLRLIGFAKKESPSTELVERLASLYSDNGCDSAQARDIATRTLAYASARMPLRGKERAIRKILARAPIGVSMHYERGVAGESLLDRIIRGFRARAVVVLGEVGPWIAGVRVLDLGCGSGYVGRAIRDTLGKRVTLADVRDANKTDLPMVVFGKKLPFSEDYFDTVVLVAVLHHAFDYRNLLEEARRVGKRIAVIETTCGDGSARASCAHELFFDWFYNNVILDGDIPIPGNFLTPEKWRAVFSKCGLRVVHEGDLGENYKNIFLRHHLFILEK